MKPSTRLAALAVVTAGSFGLLGCAADPSDSGVTGPTGPTASSTMAPESSAPPATFAPNGESVTVQAIDNSFRPDPLEVVAGTEVVFENRGRNDHNVLPKGDPAAAAWGVQKEQFAPGDSYAFVFGAPGTYAYYCSIHGTDEIGMVGTVVVTEP